MYLISTSKVYVLTTVFNSSTNCSLYVSENLKLPLVTRERSFCYLCSATTVLVFAIDNHWGKIVFSVGS